MNITNVKMWNEAVHNNWSHQGVINFAIRWAEAMEVRIAQGERLDDIVDQCETETDTEGLTGSEFVMAVNLLRETWKHGEELRRWYRETWGGR